MPHKKKKEQTPIPGPKMIYYGKFVPISANQRKKLQQILIPDLLYYLRTHSSSSERLPVLSHAPLHPVSSHYQYLFSDARAPSRPLDLDVTIWKPDNMIAPDEESMRPFNTRLFHDALFSFGFLPPLPGPNVFVQTC